MSSKLLITAEYFLTGEQRGETQPVSCGQSHSQMTKLSPLFLAHQQHQLWIELAVLVFWLWASVRAKHVSSRDISHITYALTKEFISESRGSINIFKRALLSEHSFVLKKSH